MGFMVEDRLVAIFKKNREMNQSSLPDPNLVKLKNKSSQNHSKPF